MRDIFIPQQNAKLQHRASQWTCGFCGKSFYDEKFLDMHFDNRHKNNINMAEDAVCLADYCDIMRCEVLQTLDISSSSSLEASHLNTDIEIWREATAYHTALTTAGPRDLARVSTKSEIFPRNHALPTSINHHCPRTEAPPFLSTENDNNSSDVCDNNLVDSSMPPKQRLNELQKLKANCKPEVLQKVKTRCEILVRDCIAGLLVNLSVQDFKDVEEELNQAVCWYLTCERYWQDSPADPRPFPWGLVFVFIMILSLGICLCYYIIWVLFDSDDMSEASTSVTASSSPAHLSHYSDDYYAIPDDLAQSEHYIYVTYPPDLKRRLLERSKRLL
uniref:C2H2-type domain-containing protein n=1 Tax=Clastoptera arizonana TaxID=38151 RepID=A0A1B6C3F9_9HEMI